MNVVHERVNQCAEILEFLHLLIRILRGVHFKCDVGSDQLAVSGMHLGTFVHVLLKLIVGYRFSTVTFKRK